LSQQKSYVPLTTEELVGYLESQVQTQSKDLPPPVDCDPSGETDIVVRDEVDSQTESNVITHDEAGPQCQAHALTTMIDAITIDSAYSHPVPTSVHSAGSTLVSFDQSGPTRTERRKSRRYGVLRNLGNVLFYVALLVILVVGLAYGVSTSAHRGVWGFSFHEVLTDSMQSDIAQGALVVVRETDPVLLRIGDDITFFVDAQTTVTHRIVSIIENYDDSGQRGFETQGIENLRVDDEITLAHNVIGKVIYVFSDFAAVRTYTVENWPIIAALAAGLVVMAALLSVLFARDEETTTEPTTHGSLVHEPPHTTTGAPKHESSAFSHIYQMLIPRKEVSV